MGSSSSGMMIPYLHFTPGDYLLFQAWIPTSAGAMVGASIGLFLLALVDRWIAASRAIMEAHWIRRAQIAYAAKLHASMSEIEALKSGAIPKEPGVLSAVFMRRAPPFIPSHDISRGFLHAVQAALGFTFMLAVMSFNGAFIIAIIVGLGVGETLFGRFASLGRQHGH
ncbi:hypothetical protein BDZ89DRAFT_965687 [Hymenopellis radicata]|nr:hypothetical protein BDZ89DRAFT_965687 [Hymenopellis radicata]